MWTERRSGPSQKRSERDNRSPYERDKTRVIHCPSFRRLQRKTQILGTEKGDFHRTRLTHSLEVGSIGVSIVRHLQAQNPAYAETLPSDDLITTICLLHDIGHPPFGHGGEVALNYMMREHGGFESNGQTLRLLTKLEASYGTFGLDLTRRTLLGILKYPAAREKVLAKALPHEPIKTKSQTLCINSWLPPKAYFATEQEEVDWILAPLSSTEKNHFQSLHQLPTKTAHGHTTYQSLDCSIMNIADDIAYGVHDLEDAIHLHLIYREQLETPELCALLAATTLPHPDKLLGLLFHPDIHERKEAIGELVNYFITSVEFASPSSLFETPILAHQAILTPPAQALLDQLIAYVYQYVIDSQTARTFEFGGQTIILHLFEALRSNPNSLLEKKHRALYQAAKDEPLAYRVLCDYIANMTDEYAYRLHERLFGFSSRSVLEYF